MNQSKVITSSSTELIDLGSKKFFKYPSTTSDFEIKKTVLKGRSPENAENAYIESESFGIYILKGTGKILLDSSWSNIQEEDVVYVLKGTKWAIEGEMEYIVVNVPVWKPEQISEVNI